MGAREAAKIASKTKNSGKRVLKIRFRRGKDFFHHPRKAPCFAGTKMTLRRGSFGLAPASILFHTIFPGLSRFLGKGECGLALGAPGARTASRAAGRTARRAARRASG